MFYQDNRREYINKLNTFWIFLWGGFKQNLLESFYLNCLVMHERLSLKSQFFFTLNFLNLNVSDAPQNVGNGRAQSGSL